MKASTLLEWAVAYDKATTNLKSKDDDFVSRTLSVEVVEFMRCEYGFRNCCKEVGVDWDL